MDEFTVPLTPEQRRAIADDTELAIEAALTAIAERSAQAKRTNKAAVALFRELAALPGVHVGRIDERTADGRFAVEDE